MEAMIDLVAMAAKELGFQVQDDETNIQNLTKTMGIDKELGNKLKKANGMRNLIVHRYNGIEDKRILQSIPEIKDLLTKWIDIIEEIIGTNS
ncbi:MAG: DUF86 domain-containing protein [Candidatus Lokiarchaeota archaeon]|nr:DUF86 domain-containing protein [Candidatus Harpocratesius repetitus]